MAERTSDPAGGGSAPLKTDLASRALWAAWQSQSWTAHLLHHNLDACLQPWYLQPCLTFSVDILGIIPGRHQRCLMSSLARLKPVTVAYSPFGLPADYKTNHPAGQAGLASQEACTLAAQGNDEQYNVQMTSQIPSTTKARSNNRVHVAAA